MGWFSSNGIRMTLHPNTPDSVLQERAGLPQPFSVYSRVGDATLLGAVTAT